MTDALCAAAEGAEQRLGEMALARGAAQEEAAMLRQALTHVAPDTGEDTRRSGRAVHDAAEHRHRWQLLWDAVQDAAEHRRLCLAGEGDGACRRRTVTDAGVQASACSDPPEDAEDESPQLRRLRGALADVQAVALARGLWRFLGEAGGLALGNGLDGVEPLACATAAVAWASQLARLLEVRRYLVGSVDLDQRAVDKSFTDLVKGYWELAKLFQ